MLSLVVILLSGCATKTSSNVVPDYPIAGPEVAEELSTKCGGDFMPNCPNTFRWLNDLELFKMRLDAL